MNRTVADTMLGLVVFVDPGHGGYDPGTEREQILEKNINLQISEKLFDKMLSEGMTGLMARTGDYDLSSAYSKNHKLEDLKKRAEYINHSGANILVSVHLNALSDSSVHGPMVYYRAKDQLSGELASAIQDRLNDLTGLDKIIHEENYYLFKATKIPAVLVECGFLSNAEERNRLLNEKYQEKIARAIFEGVKVFWLDKISAL